MLGALPEPELHDATVVLSPGDVLLLYTDGVTESRTPEGFFGPIGSPAHSEPPGERTPRASPAASRRQSPRRRAAGSPTTSRCS